LENKNEGNQKVAQSFTLKDETVCAVVVTYNRKRLLLCCLEALLKQSRSLNAIYVIDNASTDGTPEALLEHKYIPKLPPSNIEEPWEIFYTIANLQDLGTNSKLSVIIYYVRMQENGGAAGGFYEGVKRSYEKGYDWTWLMDDDGFPSEDCLNKLLLGGKKFHANFLAPLVIDINNSGRLSFGIFDYKNEQTIYTFHEAMKYSINGSFEGTACPYNGILISKELIKIAGYPKREMFIWGDEIEYFLRIKGKGFKVITICNAIHKHPKGKIGKHKIFFGQFLVGFNNQKFIDYCRFRNKAFICKKYNANKLLKDIIKYTWFFIISRKFDLKNMFFYLSATIDGLKGDFSKHRNFL
jgi:GT2 family glycosyltransferase